MDNLSSEFILPVELLELNDIEIESVKLNQENEIIIEVKSTTLEIPCHHFGKPTKPYSKGQTLHLRHLPILGKKTIIVITPSRGRCEQCDTNPTTTQTLPWYDRNAHYTKAYEKQIIFALIHSTLADVSIKEDISESVIQHIVDKYVTDTVDWKKIKTIGLMGADEISLKKGYQNYLTIMTSRVNDETNLLAVIKEREKSAIKAFFESIPKKKHKTIIALCCDMYECYRTAAKEVFGNSAMVILDRFHIAKLYRRCLVTLCQQELARLKRELTSDAYQALKQEIAILVKPQECYSKQDKEQLATLFQLPPLIKIAYRLARQLTSIFNTKHRKQTAKKKFNEWIQKS